jgi:hypothetical protein
MFRPLTASHRRPHRRGTSFVLIVVIMLSITAAGATAFALMSLKVKTVTGLQADAQGRGGKVRPEVPDPTDTVNRFFGALIYDVGDDQYADLINALRGHSFAASMYGRTPGNTTPYNGVGTFHQQGSTYAYGAAAYGLTGDRARYVAYNPMTLNGLPFLLDPEWTQHRGHAGGAWPASFAASQGGRAYVSKAAGYSYPDLKDFFLAQLDPGTGEVLTPSFHRNTAFGSLAPSNGNWYNAEGRLLTLRPRPAEHPNFPRVPPDSDGIYRGDVQNFPGGYRYDASTGRYYAINDSLWMNIGLPTTFIGTKRVQPLVAPLIVPLNGLFDASSHGNTFGANAHRGAQGFGPWEVNGRYGLSNYDAEHANVVNQRGPRQQRNGTASRAFAPSNSGTLPSGSPVAWNSAPAGFPAYPSGPFLGGVPAFGPAAYQDDNGAVNGHPALYSPTEWPTSNLLANRAYPTSDVKRLNLRYAFTPFWYSESDLAPFAPNALRGTAGFTVATSQTTRHGYRLDPAHPNRALWTTRSYELDRPKVVPNFIDGGGAGPVRGLEYGTGPGGPEKAGVVAPGTPPLIPGGAATFSPYPQPQNRGALTDFAAPNAAGAHQWYNAMARLGSVNVNRPLADYRLDLTAALSAGNMGNVATATADRQQLARDIFVRFVVALGAGAVVDPATGNYTVTAPAGSTQYHALRYLAQLSVNIVDYIDNDDISTVFIWNPDALTPGGVDFNSAGDVGNRVVFGVEKPRLVINEAYSEVVNAPNDPPNGPGNGMGGNNPPAGPAHVRFWFELLNPTTTNNHNPVGVPPTVNVLGTGAVTLSGYRIEIRRADRQTGVGAANRDAANTTQSNHLFTNPANVTGSFEPTAGDPDAVYTFPAVPAANTPGAVEPNNGAYRPAANALPANGFVLVGPPANNRQDNFAPNGGVWQNKVGDAAGDPTPAPGSTALGYSIPLPGNGVVTGTEFKRHIVLLRRLANPYAGPSPSNPFITTDMMDYVPSFDSINRLNGGGLNRNEHGMMNGNGYDPLAGRFAIGKVQPYAAFCAPTAWRGGAVNYNTYTFPNSMVLRQTVANGGQPLHTFGQHNGATQNPLDSATYVPGAAPQLRNVDGMGNARTETLMAPFDWLVHMDRQLINQSELFQVRDTPPHRVTNQFVRATNAVTPSGAAPGVTYDAGFANWRAIQDGVARAFEYLTVRPYTAGVAHGGRMPGRVNINAVQDRRVLHGLFDPQGGNGFGPAFVDNTAWAQWFNTRTAVETSTQADGVTVVNRARAAQGTIIEGFGGDRPFVPFGGPAAAGNAGAFAYVNGGNIDQTILRRPPPPAVMPATGLIGPHPHLYTNAGNSLATYPSSHPDGPDYHRAEPLRKVMNNLTYVNQQYAVFVTIGYFEVDGTVATANGQSIPRLGAEAYLNVPGDARHQYFAVVDMSNMALDPASGGAATGPRFFTSLEATARPAGMSGNATLNVAYSRFDATNVYVASDGQEVPISVGSRLVLGYGVEEQIVTVTGIVGNAVQVTGMTRTAWGGTSVSNVRPGYPGPQPAFRPDDPAHKPVIPYFDKVK